ncbi:hypothetical protein E3P96_02072 [Wallemia ichthyophaga]|nr:hypothetical protein E3P91_02057 [Wallemia ichthyophaga]TIB02567.1 hypothetical protein E3P96_02072 [Wallemia ichthyophaga]
MSSSLDIASTYTLPAGNNIPVLQLGVYKSPADVTHRSVQSAIQLGYRGVDTAQYYANESEAGSAIRESGKNIFITSKIMDSAGDVDANYAKCLESVNKINVGAVDLFLIHSPRYPNGAQDRKAVWLALERLAKEGRVKAIGVSNYGVKHLKELEEYASLPISVNQIELHPWNQMNDIVTYCKQKGIVVEAYCPLVRGRKADDAHLVKIAEQTGKSWAQVLVRWSLQRGFVVLPKWVNYIPRGLLTYYRSDNADRQKLNADVFDFELSDDQMTLLNGLDAGEHIAPCPIDCD